MLDVGGQSVLRQRQIQPKLDTQSHGASLPPRRILLRDEGTQDRRAGAIDGQPVILEGGAMNTSLEKVISLLVVGLLLSGCYTYISPEASEELNARAGPFSVSVYPVNVIRPPGTIQPNIRLAENVVTFLETEKLANPVLVKEPILYDFVFSPNQAKIVAHSAKAFATQISEAGIGTDYALLVEIMMLPDGLPGGIHYYLSDSKGELADGSFTNDHWDDFKAVQPKTPDDGYEVAIRMLRRNWGK